jgi:hypothetical protein
MNPDSSNNAALPCVEDFAAGVTHISYGKLVLNVIQPYFETRMCQAYVVVVAYPGYKRLADEVREPRILHYSSCQNFQQDGACFGLLPRLKTPHDDSDGGSSVLKAIG